jgi:CDP-glucose 4,6-dehydratase
MTAYWPSAQVDLEGQGTARQHESNLLKLCCDKALNALDWHAVLAFPETIRFTATWYKAFYDRSREMPAFLEAQIAEYEDRARQEGLSWTR